MKIPFSRYGSFLVISPIYFGDYDQNALYIRMIRGGDEKSGAIFKINLVEEELVLQDYEVEFSPHLLRLIGNKGTLECCFSSESTIRIKGNGLSLQLTALTGSYDYALACPDQSWEINSFKQKRRFRIIPIEGNVDVRAPFEVDKSKFIHIICRPNGSDQTFETAISDYQIIFEKDTSLELSFIESVKRVEDEFTCWKEKTLKVPDQYRSGWEMASYITWSCVVKAEGLLTRPAMFMSKNWMTNIWSWDHCFNAMALMKEQPELAWDQYCIFFDSQDESGALPDFLNDQSSLWNCCKPPIHGWTLKWMMERSPYITNEKLSEIYDPLVKWTNWWYIHRDDDHDGIPQYNHGNDSGWDNSTVFSEGIPVETPDLATFLIIQMDVLATIAKRLGKTNEEKAWKKRADETLNKMMEHFWTEDGFQACLSGSHKPISSQSLILFIPFILGDRLSKMQKDVLLHRLLHQNQFETDHGFATESLASPYYRQDGYWRGPIWAPSTMLLIEGLKAIGEIDLAKKTAENFCTMANQSGMAENFNAVSGEGLRDPAFTWTSSVFLILAHEL
ncbi:amylo-alpha-1,6-glucosidase [Peribacillus alkalitolerans]|uniref:amylo-alpha-1,6-glucosidase n=1 Tax=Peribacillus alkalitolerans TaxID=1550385 RepID=UPI0013CFB816|nr:trehalase family glycosidase [Peribacillus alkalitolerans]